MATVSEPESGTARTALMLTFLQTRDSLDQVIRALIVVATGSFMRPFIAFICKQTDSGFRVSFPDLPNCHSTGPTIAEARENAAQALLLHCRQLQQSGLQLPPPSYMHQIARTQERITDGLVVLIALREAA